MASNNSSNFGSARSGFILFLICLLGILCFLFSRSFQGGMAHFSNDGPLSVVRAACLAVPAAFSGQWVDMNWVGTSGGSAPLNINSAVALLLGPIGYAKFMAPLAIALLGLCAWVFFRQLKLPALLCIVAALAAALNSNFFSNVCWGLGSRAFTIGMIFLALAALTNSSRPAWIRIPLAGLAVGMSIMDGADNGAIFSLYVAAYALFLALIEEGPVAKKFFKGAVQVVLVAGFAGLLATQIVISLIGTQVTGISGMKADEQSKEQRWDWATQWSLPKSEILRVIVPGLNGYRMDTPDGGQYWGNAGQQPGYQQHHQGFARYSGAGEYAGVLVVLIGLWAVAQAFAKTSSFSAREKKLIGFWGVLAIISILLGFGRYASFYRFVFALPFFSTIRNPIKFMHAFHLCMLILFGYGLLGLSRRYLETLPAKTLSLFAQFKAWWAKANAFEKKWTIAAVSSVALSLLGWLMYAASRKELERYLSSTDFDAALASNPTQAAATASSIAGFSISEVGLYLVFLAASVAVVTLIMSGAFAGRRAKWAALLLGLVLVIDLARANAPWIKYYNYEERYASDLVVDILRDKANEHRVTIAPFDARALRSQELNFIQNFYHVQWLQQHFPYYNVQALDMSQEPRMPADKAAYREAVNNPYRLWQLTNTRYVLGIPGLLGALNQQAGRPDAFRIAATFDIVPKAGVVNPTSYDEFTVVRNDQGKMALFEYTAALPRARLYTQWQTSTNDDVTLKQLADPAFDPAQTVLVAANLPPPTASTNAGTVQFTSYAPKHLKLTAQADAPSVLLLNDKYDPSWRVTVDGQPANYFRCNFLMRGVALTPGKHEIAFDFVPAVKGLYFSLTGILIGVVLCGLLAVTRRPEESSSAPAPATKPVLKTK